MNTRSQGYKTSYAPPPICRTPNQVTSSAYSPMPRISFGLELSRRSAKKLLVKTKTNKNVPMAFRGGKFSESEIDRTLFEKEDNMIFRRFERMDHILIGESSVHELTDHRNLLYAFAPSVVKPKHHVTCGKRSLMGHISSELQFFNFASC